jgi:hypothetical protein
MILRACPHEKEVTALMHRGQWPVAAPPELQSHVSACRACGDLVLVTHAFRGARAASVGPAHSGSAGMLWWRAQLRLRKTAVERINKPILGAQIFALSVTLIMAAAFVASQARHGLDWLSWLAQLPQSPAFHFEALWPSTLTMPAWAPMLLISGTAAVALLSGVVIYLASERH